MTNWIMGKIADKGSKEVKCEDIPSALQNNKFVSLFFGYGNENIYS